ncbi:Palmitoyltransferase DHHC domain [Trinorchestia longiramus]|nr:Palmitoyltransferase DHHC domain [Trinorchestia longiramus]
MTVVQLLPSNTHSRFLLVFFIVELFGNWYLFFRTKSFIEKSTGNSEISPGLSHSECRALRYCPNCKIYKPERSHHCSLCDRCIHQRDHHCFFLGTCVGGYNLCYFVIFCFYACVGCCYSANKLHEYYSQTYLRDFWSPQFHYYFYPVTLVHWFNGQAALVEVGWVSLLYVATSTFIFTGFCVAQQLLYVYRGQTAYEYNKARASLFSLPYRVSWLDMQHNLHSCIGYCTYCCHCRVVTATPPPLPSRSSKSGGKNLTAPLMPLPLAPCLRT